MLFATSSVSKLTSGGNITKLTNIRNILSNLVMLLLRLLQINNRNLFISKNKVNRNGFLYYYLTFQTLIYYLNFLLLF